MKPTCRISWAGNLLMLSDLTFCPSFKVKRWFTGFGELSFQWIQICIGSPMHTIFVCIKAQVRCIFQGGGGGGGGGGLLLQIKKSTLELSGNGR